MPVPVHFADLRSRSTRTNTESKIARLCDAAGLPSVVAKGDLVAVKVHFGEPGNHTFVPPWFARVVADKVREAGAVIVGGHTIDDKEPKYGLSVMGVARPEDVVRNGEGVHHVLVQHTATDLRAALAEFEREALHHPLEIALVRAEQEHRPRLPSGSECFRIHYPHAVAQLPGTDAAGQFQEAFQRGGLSQC